MFFFALESLTPKSEVQRFAKKAGTTAQLVNWIVKSSHVPARKQCRFLAFSSRVGGIADIGALQALQRPYQGSGTIRTLCGAALSTRASRHPRLPEDPPGLCGDAAGGPLAAANLLAHASRSAAVRSGRLWRSARAERDTSRLSSLFSVYVCNRSLDDSAYRLFRYCSIIRNAGTKAAAGTFQRHRK